MTTPIWQQIRDTLAAGESLAAATIAVADGSTPRSAGAKIIVGNNGFFQGTLGGGPVEAKARDEAEKTLSDGQTRLFAVDMAGSAMAGADLICGGRVRILVQRLTPDDLAAFAAICDRMRLGQDTFLLTPTDAHGSLRAVTPGSADLPAELGDACAGVRLVRHGDGEWLAEAIPAPSRLILAGGGHVSLATAEMAALADFEVSVLDDREEFASPERFPRVAPERLHVVPAFTDCFGEETLGFPVGPRCAIAILTRGHSFDGEVLAQALSTTAGYVGMIGSRRKRDAIYDKLRARGITQEQIDRTHSPIGLAIGAETPAEIAVSIVAELITVRAGLAKRADS